jgi:hypothetical protein
MGSSQSTGQLQAFSPIPQTLSPHAAHTNDVTVSH